MKKDKSLLQIRDAASTGETEARSFFIPLEVLLKVFFSVLGDVYVFFHAIVRRQI